MMRESTSIEIREYQAKIRNLLISVFEEDHF